MINVFGPLPPPYFTKDSPKDFVGENEHYSCAGGLCGCGLRGQLLLLPILRAMAWQHAAAESMTIPVGWKPDPEPFIWSHAARKILDVEEDMMDLLLKLVDGCGWSTHGGSINWGWLTEKGWRALWALEIEDGVLFDD